MRFASFACALCLVAMIICPAPVPASTGPRADLPDLYLDPADIAFSVAGTQTRGAPAGTDRVDITVTVHNRGPGAVTSANVTIYLNGTPLGVAPVAAGAALQAALAWNTSSLAAAMYTVRAVANDSAGDANPSDNAAETTFTIAVRAPGIGLALDLAVAEVALTQSAPGIAVVTGNVTVSDLGGQTLNVSLSARTDTGWTASVSPGATGVAQDMRFNFTASVSVPQGTLASRYGKLTVTAYALALDGNISASGEAILKVRPYYRLTIDSSDAYIEIAPGGQAFFELKLTNTGNAVDSFDVEIGNLLELVEDGWTVVLSTNTAAKVGPGAYKTITVSASSPQDWTLGKSESTKIIIKATSMGARDAGQNVSLTFPVYAYEQGSYPSWYNTPTLSVLAIVIIAVVAGGLWMWQTRRNRAPPSGES